MPWLPFDRLTLVTSKSFADTMVVLSEACGEQSFNLFGPRSKKTFFGEVTGDRFEIRRNISYRNSFYPVINGRVEAYGNNTLIHVRMRMIIYTMIFMAFWMTFTLVAAGTTLLPMLLGNASFQGTRLIVLLFPAFGYALCMGGFLFERRRSLDELKKITSATELPG